MKQEVAKITKVEELKRHDVTFADGTESTRERLQVKTKVKEFDPLMEDFVETDQFFTFWGDQALEAAKTLEEGDYLYIRDYREKELPATEKFTEAIIAKNVKQFAKVTQEKAELIVGKLHQLSAKKAGDALMS